MQARDYYGFAVDFDTISAGTDQTKTIKIDSGKAFFLQSLAGDFFNSSGQSYVRESTGATVTQIFGSLAVQIAVGGVQWFNNPILVSNVIGNATQPGFLLTERGIPQGSDIQVTLYNRNASANVQGQIFFSGYKAMMQ